MKAQRDQYKINVGTRSPIMTKSIEHTYGANNLPSDDINAVIGNVFMKEAAMQSKARNEAIALQKASIPKGLKAKQTLTSLMRKDVNK